MKNKPPMVYLVWGLILLLVVLHQDNWLWESDTLVFGFMPVGLFFHACISIAAAATWLLATQFAWPTGLDVPESESGDEGSNG